MERLFRISGFVALAALAAAVIWIVVRPGPADRLADLVAEMKAAGEPVTVAEFEPPLPPPDRNGAQDLDAALAWLEENPAQGDWMTRVAGPWNDTIAEPWEENATPEQMEALREFLAFLAPLFQHLDSMAEKDEIAWALGPRNSAETIGNPAVDVIVIVDAKRYLAARAAAGATPRERLAGIRGELALGSRLRTLTAIEYMVAITVHRDGSLALRDALGRGDIDAAAARAQLDALLQKDWSARFPDMVRAERAWVVQLLPYALDGSLDWSGRGANRPRWERLLERAEQLFSGGGRGPQQTPDDYIRWAREMGETLDDKPEDVRRRSLTPAGSANEMTKLSGMIVGNMCEADALAGLARVALASYEHRRLHGDWPASVAELAPLFSDGLPIDPFTGEAFELSREGDTLVLRARPWEGYLNTPEEADEKGFVWRLPPR